MRAWNGFTLYLYFYKQCIGNQMGNVGLINKIMSIIVSKNTKTDKNLIIQLIICLFHWLLL